MSLAPSAPVLLAALIAGGFSLWRIGRRLQFFLHLHQLEGYKSGPYLSWVLRRTLDVVLRPSHGLGLVILLLLALDILPVWGALLLWAMAFASSRRYRRDRTKKPLVLTPRMKREGVTAVVLGLATFTILVLMLDGVLLKPAPGSGADGSVPTGTEYWLRMLAAFWTVDVIAPFLVVVAAALMSPVERSIRNGFKRQARARLAARPDLTVVAITGSYGKTSVKFAVAEVLSQRFQVLATPGSFNTPMGICKVINNDLRDHHQVLVLEMGIRHPGDIAELCAIATPDVAVITGIGIAHLESMGSRDAIAREKGSLLDYLRPGGIAVLNADDPYHASMRDRVSAISVSAAGAPADLKADEVGFGPEGTTFTAISASETAPVRLRLLGRHHVLNGLLALAVGQHLGLRLRAGAQGLNRQEPVPHRLSMREEKGLIILDDAFNSNPVGARNAVEVLEHFAPRQRFMITPGMVELGEAEIPENRALGAYMAGRVDHAILVGPQQTLPIAQGWNESGGATERLHVVKTLFEARDLLGQLAKPGDVVLYENDLPDQYTEA